MVVIATIAIGVFALDRLVWRAEEPADTAPAPIDRSIAVLPFVNMSDDPANEYSPLLEKLRSDPRFEQMAQRLNAKT